MSVFNLPSGLVDSYNLLTQSSQDFWSKQIVLVYPPKQVKCPNCVTNIFNGISSNRYNGSGPQPFTFGNCPYCNGTGFVPTEVTENVPMVVYNNLKSFINPGINLNIPAGSIQTKCFSTYFPKVRQAAEIRYSADIAGYGLNRYVLLSDITFYGLNNRFILAIWKPFRGST